MKAHPIGYSDSRVHANALRRVQEWAGVKVVKFLGQGSQGSVYLLSNGKVMKLGNEYPEASAALFIRRHGQGVSLLPRIYSVYRLPTNPVNSTRTTWRNTYAIIREPLNDVRQFLPTEDFGHVLMQLHYGYATRDREYTNPQANRWYRQIEEYFRWANRFNVVISDLHYNNLGQRANGELVIRDFGINLHIPNLRREMSRVQ